MTGRDPGQRFGGVGDGLTPKDALKLGLKVDTGVLPKILAEAIKGGSVDLGDVKTTMDLLKADAVVGAHARWQKAREGGHHVREFPPVGVVDWHGWRTYLVRMQLRLSLNHIILVMAVTSTAAMAQERPYFVTYDHHMEEPHHLEISIQPVAAAPKEGNRFVGTATEFEFAPQAWWTTELYLDWQSTAREGSLYTGYRIENRFRLLMEEHAVNPVLYIEYANTNGADKTLREIVGFDSFHDLAEPNADTRLEKEREIETKLILSGNRNGWNTAGNLIAEKNLAGNPWEFGYAFGVSRPLALAASPYRCTLCRENFTAGVEAYGGLGEQHQRTLAGTAHYVAPCIAWTMPPGLTLRISPSFGLTANSNRFLMRFGVSYEIPLTR